MASNNITIGVATGTLVAGILLGSIGQTPAPTPAPVVKTVATDLGPWRDLKSTDDKLLGVAAQGLTDAGQGITALANGDFTTVDQANAQLTDLNNQLTQLKSQRMAELAKLGY